jgi:hypothetical protein
MWGAAEQGDAIVAEVAIAQPLSDAGLAVVP